jgi:transcriptional regulator with XRE-family HTH domain
VKPKSSPPSTFGERFTFARLFQSMHRVNETDQDFAEAVGRSKGTVSQWRKAREAPGPDVCLRIADRTGLDASWLLLGERASTAAPEPFPAWLERQRRGAPPASKAAKKRDRSG